MSGKHVEVHPQRKATQAFKYKLYVTCFVCSLLVFGLFFWAPALSEDEAVTVVAIRRSWSQIWLIRFHDPALLPYYFLLKFWSYIATSAVAMRIPSVIATSLMVVVVVVIVTEATSIRQGIFALLALLILPSISFYAQDARPYAMAGLFAALSVGFWLKYAETRSTRYLLLLTLSLVAGILMHAYVAILTIVLVATAVILRKENPPGLVRATAISSVAAWVLTLPYLLLVNSYAKGQITAPAVSVRSISYMLAALPTGVLKPFLAPLFAGSVLVLAGIGLISSWTLPAGGERRLAVVAMLWLAVPLVALILIEAIFRKPTMLPRYWEFSAPALGIVVALVLPRIVSWRTSAVAVAICLLALLASPTQAFVRGNNGHDGANWRSLHQVLTLPPLRAMPITMNGLSVDTLLAYDAGLVRQRVPIRRDAARFGLVAPVQFSTYSAEFRAAAQSARGLIAYHTRSPSSKIPTSLDFKGLVRLRQRYYVLRVSCDFFGDSLGVFGIRHDQLNNSAYLEIAKQIERQSAGAAICKVSPDHLWGSVAILAWPARRRMLISRFPMAARTWGPVPPAAASRSAASPPVRFEAVIDPRQPDPAAQVIRLLVTTRIQVSGVGDGRVGL